MFLIGECDDASIREPVPLSSVVIVWGSLICRLVIIETGGKPSLVVRQHVLEWAWLQVSRASYNARNSMVA